MIEKPQDWGEIGPESLQVLRGLYDEVDRTLAAFLKEHPAARCAPSCQQCCHEPAPLVSAVEYYLIEQAIAGLPQNMKESIVQVAAQGRQQLEAGDGDRMTCPLLHAGRCLVYAQRPYLCRSFGHSRRPALEPAGEPSLYTCDLLRAKIPRQAAPVLAFRIGALRSCGLPVVDSYLALWLTTTAAQRRVRWLEPGRGVMTAKSKS